MSGSSLSSLYEQVLGAQWDRLPPVIQKHYGLKIGDSIRVSGKMSRVYHSALLTPLLHVAGWFGMLFPEQGENVPTVLTNTAGVDSKGEAFVKWERQLSFQKRVRHFDSIVTIHEENGEKFVLEKIALSQAVAM